MSLMLSRVLRPRTNTYDPFSLDSGWEWGLFPGLRPADISGTGVAAGVQPPLDWKETPEAHVFKMDLPGLRKEDVTVEVEDGKVLRVRGERCGKDEEEVDKDGSVIRWHCMERSIARGEGRRFFTQFRLPEDAVADEVKAAMADGVLTVTVPKRKAGGKKKKHKGEEKPVCCRFWL